MQLPPQAVAIEGHHDRAAQQLARVLGNPAFRKFLFDEVSASRNKEKILDFDQFLQKAQGRQDLGLPPGILKMIAEEVTGSKIKMKELKISPELANVDLYLPVPEHRKLWRGQEELLVAVQPVGDEEKVITAYTAKDARRVTLDPKVSPPTPVLVIAARETADLRPSQAMNIPEPRPEGAETPPPPGENTYIGIPQVYLTNDHESWIKGAAEVYVFVGQTCSGRASVRKIDLSGVDYEGKWYFLGDGGPLYFHYNAADCSRMTYFRFMEEDYGFSGGSGTVTEPNTGDRYSWCCYPGDEFIGDIWMDRALLSYTRYLSQIYMGDMIAYFDKDAVWNDYN